MIVLGSPFMFGSSSKLIDLIGSLGLTSGLQLCLDPGDGNSYTSGQTWADVSGNGYDFLRGSTSSSQASDPTFNGTPNGQSASEYWSFDGGDYFTLGQANPAWVNNLHKDNAVFTALGWGRRSWSFGTDGADGTGVFFTTVSGTLSYYVYNGTHQALYSTSTLSASAGVWNFVGMSLDEASGNLTFALNGGYDAKSGQTYDAPSSGSAAYTMNLGAAGNGASPTTQDMGPLAVWNRVLSQSEMTSLFEATRSRYGV